MPNPLDIAAIEARCAAATEGPWEWYGNTKTHDCHLATMHGGRVFVMGFDRWGMQSAQPTFQIHRANGGGVMEPVARFAKYEVAYRSDFIGLDHPDATFIAHARTDVPDLCARVRRETKRADDAEAEVRRITADNERMRRGMEEAVECVDSGKAFLIVHNLLAGREWNNCADGAKGEGR